MKKSSPGVYMILNILDNTRYVGSTIKTISRRWSEHQYKLKKGINTPLLQAAWDKYGPDAFRLVALENCIGNGKEREQWWLDYFKEQGIPVYNRCPNTKDNTGLEMPKSYGENQAKIMQEFWKENPEAKAEMTENVRQWWTDERRQKRSKAMIKRWEKHRKQMLGDRQYAYRFRSPSSQIIEVLHLSNFCKAHNLDPSAMVKVGKGSRPSHKGWTSA